MAEVTSYLRNFANAPYKWLRAFRSSLEKLSLVVEPVDLAVPSLRDSKDVHVLGAAQVGNCDFLITGDKDLLELKGYKEMKILTPAEFLDLHKS